MQLQFNFFFCCHSLWSVCGKIDFVVLPGRWFVSIVENTQNMFSQIFRPKITFLMAFYLCKIRMANMLFKWPKCFYPAAVRYVNSFTFILWLLWLLNSRLLCYLFCCFLMFLHATHPPCRCLLQRPSGTDVCWIAPNNFLMMTIWCPANDSRRSWKFTRPELYKTIPVSQLNRLFLSKISNHYFSASNPKRSRNFNWQTAILLCDFIQHHNKNEFVWSDDEQITSVCVECASTTEFPSVSRSA